MNNQNVYVRGDEMFLSGSVSKPATLRATIREISDRKRNTKRNTKRAYINR